MPTITLNLSEEQISKIVDAYKTIQEFLSTVLPPNELYQEQFLSGLKEAAEDVRMKNLTEVHSFNDFAS